MPSGYISLHRQIIKHWIFKNPDHFKAWVTILITVNYTGVKVVLGGQLFICERGESLNSLDTWSDKFGIGWNKSRVRRFFKLLESDNMIVTKSEQKTTRLSVCNYEDYQKGGNTDETQMKRKRNASETQVTPNNKDNKDNNEKNKYNPLVDCPFFIDSEFKEAWNSWNETRRKKKCSFSDRAIKKAVKKLMTLCKDKKETAIKILDKSADCGWSDLYPLDGGTSEWVPPEMRNK